MNDKIIKIKCKGSRLELLSKLEIIQGDLKELSKDNFAKLRKRIETKGFDSPIFVWQNKILDGTQRKRVLDEMLKDGWTLPANKVPVCDIEAENLSEAKDRLLGYISQYGKITGDGLYEFLSTIDVPDLGTIDLPDFDFESFQQEYYTEPKGAEGFNLPDGDKSPFQQMTFTLSNEQAEVVKVAMTKAKKDGGFDDTGNENSNGNALARICEAYCD